MRKLSDSDLGCLQGIAALVGIIAVLGLMVWLFPTYGPTPTRGIIAQWVIVGAALVGAIIADAKKRVIRRREAILRTLVEALGELRAARIRVPPDDAASQRHRMAVSQAIDKAGVWGAELGQLPDEALETIEQFMAHVDVLAQAAAAREKRLNRIFGILGVIGAIIAIYGLVPK